jgi:predicted ATPase
VLLRLRASGFKNLHELDMRFGPFTCVFGENGVGKSNLFDAIRFLHLLAEHPIPEAVARLRETSSRRLQAGALFTAFGDYRATEMRFEAEMLLGPHVVDDFGATASASITSVRYTIAFRADPDAPGGMVLAHESLLPISVNDARKDLGFDARTAFKSSAITGRRPSPFMTTQDGVVQIHQEGHQGRKRPIALGKSPRAVIQSADAELPTLLAARRELQSWRALMLEPTAMRGPSDYAGPRHIDERGAHLAGALKRLADLRGVAAWRAVENRLAQLLPDVRGLRVDDDPRTETYTVEVRGPDGVFHSARALSDGTLRFLVLATLLEDPEAKGTLCLEEPENGIHPDRIEAIVRLLRDVAVDPSEPVSIDNPLRQIIVNTHSPLVFRNVGKDDAVFLESVDISIDGHRGRVAQVGVPDGSWRARMQPAPNVVAPGRVERWEQMNFDFHDAAE